MTIEMALLSVSDRTGIVELAQSLSGMNVEILSTGGTAKVLQNAGLKITPVCDYTGFPEILDGRVKTLHPRVHGGILARPDDPHHQGMLKEHGIRPIGLVVVNLYPFVETVQRGGVTAEEAVEQIDIGGPALIRASAKNFRYVTVVVDPSDYGSILSEMASGGGETRAETRRRLAHKAFQHTATYDLAVSAYFEELDSGDQELPPALVLGLRRERSLRYGENPHQRAALYRPRFSGSAGLVGARQLQGKELSFNNYLDLDAAARLCAEFEEAFCAIVKHTNPCGAALGATPAEAYHKALSCDPASAFGSVMGFNRAVDAETAEALKSLFVEAVIAPHYAPEALDILAGKKNLRLMEMAQGPQGGFREFDFRKISGGFLVQEADRSTVSRRQLKLVTRRPPTEAEVADLLFAWAVCKHVKSNAIVCARGGQTVAVGAGQMSRVDAVRLGAQKAQTSLQGSVLASDAFFPFRDGLDEAARAGVRAVIQPGGSIRDEEVVQAADEHDMAMLFTGVRHFRH